MRRSYGRASAKAILEKFQLSKTYRKQIHGKRCGDNSCAKKPYFWIQIRHFDDRNQSIVSETFRVSKKQVRTLNMSGMKSRKRLLKNPYCELFIEHCNDYSRTTSNVLEKQLEKKDHVNIFQFQTKVKKFRVEGMKRHIWRGRYETGHHISSFPMSTGSPHSNSSFKEKTIEKDNLKKF